MPSRRYINQLGERENINEIFLLAEKQLRPNKNGNLYLLMRLADRTGNVNAMMWNASDLTGKEFNTGDFYFRRNLFDSAIKYWEFVINLYPDSEFAPDALLGVYRANMMIGYEDLAEEARQRLLLEYPDSDAATEVRLDESGR